MPQKTPPRPRQAKRRARSRSVTALTTRRAAASAERLIEAMLLAMQQAIEKPGTHQDESWQVLFGSKESMVANLQKLVATLAALPPAEGDTHEAEPHPQGALSAEDIAILKAWLSLPPKED